VPSLVPARSYTRRDALRLGAGVVALGALRPAGRALAAPPPAPELFSLAIPDRGAVAAGASWRLTPVLRAPARFDLAGLSWAAGASAPQAQLRARRLGGRWTPWLALPALAGHAPDGRAAPPGTDPAFTGPADELQLRLRGGARDLRARLVSALAAPRVHSAEVELPDVIPRAAWGAAALPPRAAPLYGVVETAFVHHTVGTNDYGPGDSAGIVLGIAKFHRDVNGWNDIGYNFLVDRYGQVFEGRAGGIEAAVVGAQAQGYNAQSTGIASLGTFSAAGQTPAGLLALARLIGWKLSLHGVPVQGTVTLTSAGGPTNRYAAGTPVTIDRISGHRDGDQTDCPGAALYAQLPQLRTRAQGFSGAVSAVTLRAPAAQRGDRPIALSGTLRFADDSSPQGGTIMIEYASAGSAWTKLDTAVCDTQGAWATSVALPASGRVRAFFAANAWHPQLASSPVTVTVVPALTLRSDARRKKAGRAFAISGTLAPAQPLVLCLLERQIGGRWHTVQRKRISAASGRYKTTVKTGKAGLYRVSISSGASVERRSLRALH